MPQKIANQFIPAGADGDNSEKNKFAEALKYLNDHPSLKLWVVFIMMNFTYWMIIFIISILKG